MDRAGAGRHNHGSSGCDRQCRQRGAGRGRRRGRRHSSRGGPGTHGGAAVPIPRLPNRERGHHRIRPARRARRPMGRPRRRAGLARRRAGRGGSCSARRTGGLSTWRTRPAPESVAFPAISAGVYGYPLDRAASVALRAVRDGLAQARTVERAIFVLFGRDALGAFERALRDLAGPMTAPPATSVPAAILRMERARLSRRVPVGRRHRRPPGRGRQLEQRLVGLGAAAGHALQGAQRRRHRPLQPLPARHGAARRPRLQHLPLLGGVGPHRAERGRLRRGPARPLPRMVDAVRKSKLIADGHAQPLHACRCGSPSRAAGCRRPTPALFERYVRRVVEALGDGVDWYCTINEPGVVAFGGYLGALGFPPGPHGLANWKRAATGLIEAHRRRSRGRQGAAPERAGRPDPLDAGVGGERRRPTGHGVRPPHDGGRLPRGVGRGRLRRRPDLHARPARAAAAVGWLARPGPGGRPAREAASCRDVVSPDSGDSAPADARTGHPRARRWATSSGPQAVAATVRRVAELLPGKPIVVTEHGVATADDAERVEFITAGLRPSTPSSRTASRSAATSTGAPSTTSSGRSGYAMQFGLIGVDRATQERTVRPSARFLGEIARANRLRLPVDWPGGRNAAGARGPG